MRDIATTTLSGNLTRDVELRQLPSGADVARLRDRDHHPPSQRRGMGRQDQLLHDRGVRRPGPRVRAVPVQGLARVRRRRARLARMDRPAEQQARSGDLQSPPSALRRRPTRPEPHGNGTDRRTRPRPRPSRSPNRRSHTPSGAHGGQHSRPGDRRRPAVLMIDTEHHRDVDVRTQTAREEDRRNARRRVQVAAVDKLHMTVDGRTLCGLVTVDELDLYSD